MAALKEYYNSGDNNDASLTTSTRRLAQTFTTTSSYEAYSVKVKIYRTNSPGIITAGIYATDGAFKPTGSALTSGTLDTSGISSTTPGALWEILLTPYTLSTGTLYAIVLSGASIAGSNTLSWRYVTAGTYGGGLYWSSSDGGSTWTEVNINHGDALFEMYSTGPSTTAIAYDNITTKKLVAIGNNQVWYEDSVGSMASLSVATGVASGIDTTNQLVAFEGYSKVFVVNGSVLKVADFINTKLTHTALATQHNKGDILTQATSNAVMVVDFTNSAKTETYGYVTAGTFNATNTVSGSGSGTSFTPSVVTNRPTWYDWTVYPDGLSGAMPEKASLGCLYRGRCVLSGNPTYPNQWYMSRQADPWDWMYFPLDAQSAVAGGNADAGESGDIIRCLIPYGDDYLLFGCASEIWLLRGDPAAGGSMDRLTGTTGIFGPYSWCFDSARYLYCWGNNGIYRISPDFSAVENLTLDVLPSLVKDEAPNPSTHRITMGYDQIREGIVVSITVLLTGQNSCYWYDIRTGGFFPETYPNVCGAYSQFYYNANAVSLADLLMGSTDGYIRVFKDSAKDDDIGATNNAISSKVLIGPVLVGPDIDSRGRMKTLTFVTGQDTDGASCELYKKDTAEEVVDSYVADSTPFNTIALGAGRVQKFRPRTRASYLGFVIENAVASETWSLEKIAAEIKAAGGI